MPTYELLTPLLRSQRDEPIPVGTKINLDANTGGELVSSKSAILVGDEEQPAPSPTASPTPSPAPTSAPAAIKPLSKMNKGELLEAAKRENVSVPAGASNKVIAEAIEAKRKSA